LAGKNICLDFGEGGMVACAGGAVGDGRQLVRFGRTRLRGARGRGTGPALGYEVSLGKNWCRSKREVSAGRNGCIFWGDATHHQEPDATMKKITLHDLFEAKKERRQLTEIFTTDPLEAQACEAAGIEIVMTITATLKALRAAAPNVFMIATDKINDPEIANPAAAVAAGFRAMNEGADAVYTHLSTECVRAMSREKIPVVGHVGYVPYRSSWFGGPRAVGKTASEAIQVYRDTLAYQEAGAIAVEMEIVPQRVAAEIARRLEIMIFSMGSGRGGDVQYLFATDVLGTNTGHVPRHSKVYGNLHAELERVQALRVEAFRALQADVRGGTFPEAKHLLEVDEGEFAAFVEGIE
jgi:3-methyl-2-oxobutanoate hydroxymethyltransferase